jgi:hypothetical protein
MSVDDPFATVAVRNGFRAASGSVRDEAGDQLRPGDDRPDRALGLWAGLAGAGLLWWYSLGQFDLDRAGATGTIGVAPWSYLLSVAVLAGLFGWQFTRPQVRSARIGAVLAVLVIVLFSVPSLVDGTGMTPAGYVHAGFVDYIGHHHAVLANYDARFDWPAFFAAGSALVGMAGLHDALPLLTWAPIAFELLALAPMLLLARSILGRGRTAWLAVALYYTGCWFSQDYFAPQAVDHLLYLSSMAVLFWTVNGLPNGAPWGRGSLRALLTRRPEPPPGLSEGSALAIQLSLTAVIGAMVVTHQLTPLGFIIQLGVLSVLGATRYRALWLVALMFFVAWFSYEAEDFWRGHLNGLISNVGNVNGSVNRGLTSRVTSGDPTYLRMQLVRTIWSASFLLVGAIGGVILLRRSSRLAVAVGAMAVTPFGLIALQSYGGEIFLRCFLYGMPFLAVLCGVAISPALRLPAIPRGAVVAAVVFSAALALVTTRGVNVSFERVSPDALAAARMISSDAAQNPKVAVVESFAPLSFAQIDVQRVSPLGKDCEVRLVQCALAKAPNLILLSREQEEYGRLRQQLPEGWLLRSGLNQLVDGAGYRIVFDRPDAIVLQSTSATTAAAARAKATADADADSATAPSGSSGSAARAPKAAVPQKLSAAAPSWIGSRS